MSVPSLKQFLTLLFLVPVMLGAMPSDMASFIAHTTSTTAASVSQAAPVAASRPYRVGIQIGHYKNNELPDVLSRLVGSTGTSGGGRTEVDLNYDVANRVTKLLRAQGVEVDVLPATVPTGYNADAFIAIHADGNASSRPRGFKISTRWNSEVAVQDGKLVQLLTDSYRSATSLPEDSNITRNMRGYYAYSTWRANWRTSNLTPGAIVEMGYMSNIADRTVMFNAPDKVASGIANGIMSFLKSTYGAPATNGAYGYGYGLVDEKIDPLATPVPTPRPGTGSGSTPRPRIQTGDWQLVLMSSKATIGIYTGAGGVGPIMANVARGQILHATIRNGDYYQVTLSDGRKGWIHRNAVIVQL
ncbi:MAG: N-acetylmuramoyl-L-alanine amidase [Chloroflexota bacterium]